MKQQSTNIKLNTPLSLTICCLLIASGCAGKKPNSNLDSARSTYERVSSSDVVNNYSTEDLNVAKLKLDDAINAWKDKEHKSEINKLAYIASQYALIAEQRSMLLQHQAGIENGKLERATAQMDMRASEADAAKAEAKLLAAQTEQLQQQVQKREQELENKLAELAELKALQAQQTDRGMVLTLGDVLFDTNESSLRQGTRNNLQQVSAFLKKYPQRTVEIEGHTDSTGDDEYNFNLSTERAIAVKTALMTNGIEGSRIIAKGLGETTPVATNDRSEGRQRNRRVELIFDRVETMLSEIDE